jgi:hypothetical protein
VPAADVPLADDGEEDGDEDDGIDEDAAPAPLFAFVSTNDSFALEAELDPAAPDAVPEVPTAPPIRSACCRQPVIVIVLALELDWFADVELPGVDCAAAPVPNASASAATPPIHTLRFMPPPSSWVATRRSNFRSTRKSSDRAANRGAATQNDPRFGTGSVSDPNAAVCALRSPAGS